jgi:hypothetical protein
MSEKDAGHSLIKIASTEIIQPRNIKPFYFLFAEAALLAAAPRLHQSHNARPLFDEQQ